MSLNGLDAQNIYDAYQAAIAEAGGWFLLRYVNRDSVELLSRGKNGVHEARNAIAKYEEQSPLYGLIIYRRRKVLIKYIPEGTSRLLQARTAVHFQDVLERYSPYETLLEITQADGLNDTSLASSFPLHTASPSASSSRLHEISEDGEDPGTAGKGIRGQNNSGQIFGTRQYKMERRVDQLMRPSDRPTPSIYVSSETSGRTTSPLSGVTKPSLSQYLVREDSGGRSISSITSPVPSPYSDYGGSNGGSDLSAANEVDPMSKPQVPVKDLTASNPLAQNPVVQEQPGVTESPGLPTRSSARQSSNASDAGTMRREIASVKSEEPTHAIPPSTESKVDAPLDSSSGIDDLVRAFPVHTEKAPYDEPFDFSYLDKPKVKLAPRMVSPDKAKRPSMSSISALPAAFRSKPDQLRPKSQGPATLTHAQVMSSYPAPPPIPIQPEYTPRPVSRGSVKSMSSQKSTSMTPDKLRLMKALELRKRQLRKSNPQLQMPPLADDAPELPKPAPPVIEEVKPEVNEEKRTLAPTEGMNGYAPIRKPDSGIEMNYEQHSHKQPLEPRMEQSVEEESSPPATTPLQKEMQLREDEVERQEEVPKAESEVVPEATAPPSEPTLSNPSSARQSARMSRQSLKRLETSPETPAEPGPNSEPKAVLPFAGLRDPPSTDSPTLGRPAPEPVFTTSREHLLTDVPSIITTASSRPPSSSGLAEAGSEPHVVETPTEETGALDQLEHGDNLDLPPRSPKRKGSDLAKRRRGIVEPLQIAVERHNMSDGDMSDDEFLEELKSATLHEAKPMSVSKSPGPGAQFFPRRPSNQSMASKASASESPQKSSTVNSTVRNAPDVSPESVQPPATRELTGSPESYKSPHAMHPSTLDRSEGVPILRRQVSDGITRRIQALAEQSSRDTSPNAVQVPTRPITPDSELNSFIANDRRAPARSPTARTGSYRARRPTGDRVSAMPIAPSQSETSAPVWSTSQDVSSNRDSVSVRARIVRPQSTSYGQPQAEEGASAEPNTLQESRIEISHRRGIPTPTSVSQAFLPPLETSVPKNETAPSSNNRRDSTESRILNSVRRRSYGRNKGLPPPPLTGIDAVPTVNYPPPPPSSTGVSFFDDSPAVAPAATSRTSRFFKRMSNIGGNSKRRSIAAQSVGSSVASPTERTGSAAERDRSDMPPGVVVGDLNVQFPDTLLWKRRALSLSETGHLFLSAASSEHTRASLPPKRYHLSEFKAPYTPDLDRAEMPWSIWLEFVTYDGGVLQVACEDAMGQRQVLRLLGGYWKAWVG
ncbi:hypothetical protein B0A48_01398 [Cryoendolithus antarcticus]|uniref:ADF-H domain-containing protein n=1 Tax=Cryoendolithus antarcticus TaxID=1507870 RepID=A0A1V8TT51_9PEZI|nr:hypothetical protein B0A48_01398 [Cryoendolithus antarcticus]